VAVSIKRRIEAIAGKVTTAWFADKAARKPARAEGPATERKAA
jgi:hypothetical protein